MTLKAFGGITTVLKRKKKPSLNRIVREADILSTLNDVIEHMELLSGQNKDVLESAVTFKDLMGSGFKLGDISSFADGISIVPPIPPVELPDLTVPPTVAGISISATFDNVLIFWNPAVYGNHAFVEIWRAPAWQDAEKTIETNIGDAKFLVANPTTAYADKGLPEDEYRYFFRNISDAGVYGAFSSGYYVQLPPHPSYLIEKISGEIRKSDLYVDLGTEITNATLGVSDLYSVTDNQGDIIATHTLTLATQDAAIQSVSSIATSNQGVINASYTVKIDVGGYVSGFGLMNSGSTSVFGIRADRFWVAPPAGQGDTAVVPFIVDGGNVLISNAFISTAYIESIVASQITADYINALELNAVSISGGEITIGNDFSVNTSGVMYSANGVITNAFIDNGILKNMEIRDSLNNVIMSSSGVIQQTQVAGFDAAVTTLIDAAYINNLYAAQIFAGKIYAENIEGDVVDLLAKGTTSVSSGTATIVSFSVAALPFARTFALSSVYAKFEGIQEDIGGSTVTFAFKKGGVTFSSKSFSVPSTFSGSQVYIFESGVAASSVAANTTATYTISVTISGGTCPSQSCIAQVFKDGSTLS